MTWTTMEGVDYDDASRPTADEPTNTTGWIAYYAWGRGGHGKYEPKYVFLPGWNDISEIRYHIVDKYEIWIQDSESARIVIHRGVVPPAVAVRKAYRSACSAFDSAKAHVERLANELQKYDTQETGTAHD